ncbi:MAG: hypothetical protein F4Z30_07155, partial [Gemmatimonadetes bacterium]|nr:hypothetical protein [Gemmatimonadota bacterium]
MGDGDMDTAVRLFLATIALLAMVNHAYTDTARDDAEVVLEADEIDSSTVEVGDFVVVVYGQGKRQPTSGEWAKLDTARGYIKTVNQRRLIVGLEPDGWSKWIALERIHARVLVDSPSPDAIASASELATAAVGRSTQIGFGPEIGQLPETPERLSGKTQRRDAKGSGKRIAFKLVSGTLSGIGVSFGTLFLSSGAGVRGWAPITWSVLIGYPIGSAIGVSLVDPHDRFIHSLIGSLLGVGVAASATSDINLLVFPPICATLASEMFRKPPKARR